MIKKLVRKIFGKYLKGNQLKLICDGFIDLHQLYILSISLYQYYVFINKDINKFMNSL
jgi:hypothetical protein